MGISYVEGIEAVFSNMDRHFAEREQQISDAVQGAGIMCQALAKRNCPVDTGRLRASIQYYKINSKACRVKTNVSYAVFVEQGHATRRGKRIGPATFVAARPYMFPAYQAAYRALIQELTSIGA